MLVICFLGGFSVLLVGCAFLVEACVVLDFIAGVCCCLTMGLCCWWRCGWVLAGCVCLVWWFDLVCLFCLLGWVLLCELV